MRTQWPSVPCRSSFVDELRDLYHAEKQLTKALPKMAKAASDEQLREAFTQHLEETRNQIERLEEVFDSSMSRSAASAARRWKASLKKAVR